jgi:hypothetical protein
MGTHDLLIVLYILCTERIKMFQKQAVERNVMFRNNFFTNETFLRRLITSTWDLDKIIFYRYE